MSGYTSMKVNTAIGLMLSAVALALLHRETPGARIRAARVLAASVVTLGLLTLAEYLFQFDVGIDDVFIAAAPDAIAPVSSRMSPVSALGFVCGGAALLSIDARSGRVIHPFELATVAMLLVTAVGLVGYAYGVDALYHIGPYSSLAIHTAAAFLVLGCGILLARPDRGLVSLLSRDTSGSVLARRLLPTAIVLPFAFGWLRVKGEQAGLYELPFGTAVLVTALVTALIVIVWRTATSIDRTDVERKRAEETLRRTTKFNASVMNNMGEGLYTVDGDGSVTFMNPAAERLFGWTLEELRGHRMHDVTHYMHRDGSPFPAEECSGLQVLRAGRTLTDHEEVFVRKDGTFFDVVYSSSPFRENGAITGLIVVFRDVTERKRAEMELRESEQRYRRMADTAEAASRLKDQFLATLSHELRTPLNAILGYARMLRGEAISSPQKRARALEILERNAVLQHQLVDDLLDMSRITSGSVRLDVQTVSVIEPLQAAIDSVRATAEAKRVALKLDVDPLVRPICADPARLQHVFWHLVSNGVKFTAEGGRVLVSLDSDRAGVCIAIRDTGIGIAAEFLPHVCEPFRQADAGSRASMEGSAWASLSASDSSGSMPEPSALTVTDRGGAPRSPCGSRSACLPEPRSQRRRKCVPGTARPVLAFRLADSRA
jgi:PAS domain S-box-containing protein